MAYSGPCFGREVIRPIVQVLAGLGTNELNWLTGGAC